MTTNKEMERIVRSWLEPGLTTLTDDVLDPVLDQLPATPQRRPWWPARRTPTMNKIVGFAPRGRGRGRRPGRRRSAVRTCRQ